MRPPIETTGESIALIGCGKQKRPHACQAKDLYTGPLFTAARQWCEENVDRYLIASAKHLILEPDQVIEPYDLSLDDFSAEDRRWRARQIESQFRSRWQEHCTFEKGDRFVELRTRPRTILLAGRQYLQGFHEWEQSQFGCYEFEEPLAGLSIGQRIAWLRQRQVRDSFTQLSLFDDA